MAIHVQYLSQVIVRMNISKPMDDKVVQDFDKLLEEQITNTQKRLFYLIDLTSLDKNDANQAAQIIAQKLAAKGELIKNIAFLGQKKIKVKVKEIKDKTTSFTSDFEAQSWLSNKSRHDFLDKINVQNLMDRG